MSEIVIKVEGLGKRYRIGGLDPYRGLRHVLTDMVYAPFRRTHSVISRGFRDGDDARRTEERHVWALKDISLEVQRGEVLGVIGANGAGKTTLLKILSRITEPTEGSAQIHGRVGSLLEVGTGFHPELTGRENIYLNGSVLGMKKREIARKFDQIVAFSGVERFIDTPVKRFSSGMSVRLAFSVAAHLEPDILLIDEVLAVGDAAFQKKCLAKMGDVARGGRTVLFVSHNMNAVNALCSRAILLQQGRTVLDGDPSHVVAEYLKGSHERSGEQIWMDPRIAPGNDRVRLRSVRILQQGQVTGEVNIEKEVDVEVEFWNFVPGAHLSTSIHLLDPLGGPVLCTANFASASLHTDEWSGHPYPAGLFRTKCTLPGNFLNDGRYGINAIVMSDAINQEARAREAVWFTVHDTGVMNKEYSGRYGGVVRLRLPWKTNFEGPLDRVSRPEA